MEKHAKNPTSQTKITKAQVEFSQRVGRRYILPHFCHAVLVSKEVEEGEDDGEELLKSEDTVKRPFPMVLDYRLQHRRVSSKASVCDDMLAGIIAFGVTVPEK